VSYISFVAGQTGYDPDVPLSSLGDGSDCSAPADFSLSIASSPTVDLSSIGISSPVPVQALVGVGVPGLSR
jgi:hypothetical protein